MLPTNIDMVTPLSQHKKVAALEDELQQYLVHDFFDSTNHTQVTPTDYTLSPRYNLTIISLSSRYNLPIISQPLLGKQAATTYDSCYYL